LASTPTATASSSPTPEATCPPHPAVGCDVPDRSTLVLIDNDNRRGDQLLFRFANGDFDRVDTDFGDPTSTTTVLLCVYDAGGLIASAVAPAGSNWRSDRSRGYHYRAAGDAVLTIDLRAGTGGEPGPASATILSRGSDAAMPNIPLSLPVTAQIVTSSNTNCLEDSYETARRNSVRGARKVFRARH
jgi:hypothetical protein